MADAFDPDSFIEEFNPDSFLAQAGGGDETTAPQEQSFNPDKFISDFDPDAFLTANSGQPEAEGAIGTFARKGAHAVVPATAGIYASGALGAVGGSIAGPVGAIVGGLGGMVAGALGASYVQDKALKAAGYNDDIQMAVNEEAHPIASFAGAVAPFLGNPVLATEKGAAGLAGQFTGNALKQRAIGAGAVTAFEGAGQLYEGEFHPGKLAGSALVGGATPAGNFATQAIHKAGAGAGESAVARFAPGRPDTQPGGEVAKADADVSQSPSGAGNNALAQQPAADPKAPIGQENSKASGPENYTKEKSTQDEVFGQTGFGGFSAGDAHTDPTMQAATKSQATLAPERDLPPQVRGEDLGFPEQPAPAPEAPKPAPLVDPRVEQAKQFKAAVEQEFGGKRVPTDIKAKYDESVRLIRGEASAEPPKATLAPGEPAKPAEETYTPEQQAERLASIEAKKAAPRATLAPAEGEAPPVHDDTALIAKMRKQGMDKLAERFEATPTKGRDLMREHILANMPRDRTAEKAGLKNKIGQEANTKEQLGKQNSAIDAIQKAHDEHLPGVDETAPQLMERLKAAVDTAHTAHGSNPLGKKSGYLPRSAPDTFRWFKLVQDGAARKPAYWTQDKVDAFLAEEAALRSGTGGEYPVRPGLENEIGLNQRTGNAVVEAVRNREAGENPYETENNVAAAIDAKNAFVPQRRLIKKGQQEPVEPWKSQKELAATKSAEEALNKIETEEQETAYATPKETKITSRATLRDADPTTNLAAPLQEKPAKVSKSKALRDKIAARAEAAMEAKEAKRSGIQLTPEEVAKLGGKGVIKGSEVDPAEKARILAEMNKASAGAARRAVSRPGAREVEEKYSPITKDILGNIVDDQRGGLDFKKIEDALKKQFANFAKKAEAIDKDWDFKIKPSYSAKRVTEEAQQAARNIDELLNRTGKIDSVIKWEGLRGKLKAHTLADTAAQQKELYRAGRDSSKITDPALRKIHEDHIAPVLHEIDVDRAWIEKFHPEVDIGRPTEDGMHRQSENGGDLEAELASIGDNTDPTAGSSPISVNRGDPIRERQFVALEDADGNRHIIHLGLNPNGKPSGEFSVWKNYKNQEAEGAPPIDPKFKVNDIYEIGNRRFKMKDATIDEIHDNALGNDDKPMRYQEDAAASVYTASVYHRQLVNHLKALDAIKASAEFKKYATPLGSEKVVPEDWKQSETPGFEGFKMDKHMRETLEDAYQQGFNDSSLNKIRNFSRAMTQSIFWTPVAHVMNVEVHWAVGRGWKWLPNDPIGGHNYRDLVETGTQAIKSVITRDNIQKVLHEEGAGLIQGGIHTENSTQRLALGVGKAIERNPTGWGPIADKMNMTVGELVRGVYKVSRNIMWSANDMFLTQAILERLRDQKLTVETASKDQIRDAIAHIERHIPNYRTPSRIMSSDEGGRTIAKFMRDPLVFGFGRYRYAVFNSFANMTNSVLHGSKADRIETAGQMMVLGAVALAVYPLLYKPIANLLTGNEAAEVRGRGPVAPYMHVKHDLFGHGDLVPLVKETVSLSPFLSSAIEAWQGKNFAGKDIVNKKDFNEAITGSPKAAYNVAKQAGGWALGQRYSPFSTLNSAMSNPNQGPAGGLRDAVLDLKNPSPKSQKYDANTARRLNQEKNQRTKAGGQSFLEKMLP